MSDQPDWIDAVGAEQLVELIDHAFRKKYSRPMTKRARKELRRVLNEELATLENDTRYETGTESPQHAADRFAELAAGELALTGKADFKPSPVHPTLNRYAKVGVVAIIETVEKARRYHRANNGLCPVWPF